MTVKHNIIWLVSQWTLLVTFKMWLRFCNVADYKRWAKTWGLVSCMVHTFEYRSRPAKQIFHYILIKYWKSLGYRNILLLSSQLLKTFNASKSRLSSSLSPTQLGDLRAMHHRSLLLPPRGYLLGIGTLEFRNPDCPRALLGSPFSGVTSDIFRGIVFFRIGKAPETFDFSLLIASWKGIKIKSWNDAVGLCYTFVWYIIPVTLIWTSVTRKSNKILPNF